MSSANNTCICLDPDHTIFNAAVASYDHISGIQIVYIWEFEANHQKKLLDLFRITLLSVHRQNDSFFKHFSTSVVADEASNTTMISSTFKHKTKKSTTFYSFAFFVRLDRMKSNTQINDIFSNRITEVTEKLQFFITNDIPISTATPYVQKMATDITVILNSGVKNFPLINNAINSYEFQFLSTCLFAHLGSQMTTVLELEENQTGDDVPLFSFLAAFMLPYQQDLSSTVTRPQPIPGLFLQCVSPCPGLPAQILLQFQRPWTWIRVGKKEVYHTKDIAAHKSAYNLYRETVILKSDLKEEELKVRTQRCKKKDDYVAEVTGTNWTSNTLRLLQKMPNNIQLSLITQKLNELLQKAVTLISATDYYLSKVEAHFLQPSQMKDICKKLGIEEDERDTVISVANIFDKQICNRLCTIREEALKQMVVMV